MGFALLTLDVVIGEHIRFLVYCILRQSIWLAYNMTAIQCIFVQSAVVVIVAIKYVCIPTTYHSTSAHGLPRAFTPPL